MELLDTSEGGLRPGNVGAGGRAEDEGVIFCVVSAVKANGSCGWDSLGEPLSLEPNCLAGDSTATARERRPTGEGVKNLESPSISPLVFLLTVSVAGVEVGVRGGVVVGVEVVNWVASTAQQGSATANLSLASFTDAA